MLAGVGVRARSPRTSSPHMTFELITDEEECSVIRTCPRVSSMQLRILSSNACHVLHASGHIVPSCTQQASMEWLEPAKAPASSGH